MTPSHPPRPSIQPIRLSQHHKRWLYAIAAALLLSGLGWLIAHHLLGGKGEFGDAPHPSEPWWLRVHGAAAMGFLIGLGSLLPGHISRAWQLRKNHRSGLCMLALIALLIATGYGLYYAGDETSRPWISTLHWLLGIVAAAVAPLHVYLGRRRTMPHRAASNTRSRAGSPQAASESPERKPV